jgi:hemerythrin-like domain-containing protein
MSQAVTRTPYDTSSMGVVHSVFRREFRLAGDLIRGVTIGDTERAAVVADHLEMVHRHLHHHHTAEDELIWPKLLERVPEEIAPLVRTMESQHAVVDRLQEQVTALLPRWRESAGEADRQRLADLHDRLHDSLVEHLDLEEAEMLPVVAQTLTWEEWHELSVRGRAGTPLDEQLLVVGMFAYDGDPRAFAAMMADAPPPVRWAIPRLGRRAYRRHATAVDGTATP